MKVGHAWIIFCTYEGCSHKPAGQVGDTKKTKYVYKSVVLW